MRKQRAISVDARTGTVAFQGATGFIILTSLLMSAATPSCAATYVQFATPLGTIELELLEKLPPLSVANFNLHTE